VYDALGLFVLWMDNYYYPAVDVGYAGVLNPYGSKVGGMTIDNVKGMPTFENMYVK
jgi:hypothetical protein